MHGIRTIALIGIVGLGLGPLAAGILAAFGTPAAVTLAPLAGFAVFLSGIVGPRPRAPLITRRSGARGVAVLGERKINLTFDDGQQVVVPLTAVEAMFVDANEHLHVRLESHAGAHVELEIVTSDTDTELLQRMGFGTAQRTHAVWLHNPWLLPVAGARMGAFAGFAYAWAGLARALTTALRGGEPSFTAAAPVAMVLCLLAARALARFYRPARAIVGTDGIAWPRGKRYIPWGDVGEASTDAQRITLNLHDGSKVTIRTVGDAAGHARRIREAMAHRGTSAHAPLDLLDRGSRDASTWKEQLVRLASGQGEYRAPPLTDEQLEAALNDGDIEPQKRVAAAIVLASSGDPDDQQRIRIAARATADDDLRIALEQAAEQEVADEEIGRAQRRHAH